MHREVVHQRLYAGLSGHRAAARAAAPVGGGEGLVQVEVHHVKAHIAGAGDLTSGLFALMLLAAAVLVQGVYRRLDLGKRPR